MTYEEREAIFAKEVLDLDDVMKLFDISRNEASRLMNAIRLKVGDRLGLTLPTAEAGGFSLR